MSFLTFLVGWHLVQEGERNNKEQHLAHLESQELRRRLAEEERYYNEQRRLSEQEFQLRQKWNYFCDEQEKLRAVSQPKSRDLDWEVLIAKNIPSFILKLSPSEGFSSYKVARQTLIEYISNEIAQKDREEEDREEKMERLTWEIEEEKYQRLLWEMGISD